MIARTRRRLLMAARALGEKDVPPPGAEDPGVYRGARSGFFVSNEVSDWQEIYARQLAMAARPGGIAQAVAD